jgi:hypothetical protein
VSDIVIDSDETVTVLCDNLRVHGHDLILDSHERRREGVSSTRRALVHSQNDGLILNFDGDYPGGVTIVDVAAIMPQQGDGFLPELIVRGGISYEVETVHGGGTHHGPVPIGSPGPVSPIGRVTVSLDGELRRLQEQISVLVSKVAALEAAILHH